MVSVLKVEWSLAIRTWRFPITVALALGMLLLAMWQNARPWWPEAAPHWTNMFYVMLYSLGYYVDALWLVFAPLLAALPRGDTVAVDRRRGVDALAITRVGWAKYLWGKVLGSALVAVASIAVAVGIASLIAALVYGTALPHLIAWKYSASYPLKVKLSGVFANAYPPTFETRLFWQAPGLYLALVVAVALWATAALSSLAVAASTWVRQPLLTLAVPFALFIGGDVAAEALLTGHLVPSVYTGAYLAGYAQISSWAPLFLYWSAPAAATTLVIAWMVVWRREWPERSMGR